MTKLEERHTHRRCLQLAKQWARGRSEVQAVYHGYRERGGVRTDDKCIVIVVDKKKPRPDIAVGAAVPPDFDGLSTDVQERTYKALALTQRRRPCEAGFSIGHVQVTAGTFGAPVRLGASDEWYALTNNHVAANSNEASPRDPIIQPGTADGGELSSDLWGRLHEYVRINFEGDSPPSDGKGKSGVAGMLARGYWKTFTGVSAFGAWITRCPYRLRVVPMAVEQPAINLVDAAIVKVAEGALDPIVYQLGGITGMVEFEVGNEVQKTGRTTSHTLGRVVGVDGSVRVSYGPSKVAQFDGQTFIESTGSGDFSAGGDSGSAILNMQMQFGALLFAGGGGQTIGNPASHVISLLGVRVV